MGSKTDIDGFFDRVNKKDVYLPMILHDSIELTWDNKKENKMAFLSTVPEVYTVLLTDKTKIEVKNVHNVKYGNGIGFYNKEDKLIISFSSASYIYYYPETSPTTPPEPVKPDFAILA